MKSCSINWIATVIFIFVQQPLLIASLITSSFKVVKLIQTCWPIQKKYTGFKLAGGRGIETNDPKRLARHLEARFEEKMKNINVPLFHDFTTFSRSLPVREYEYEFINLFNLSYYVRPNDLKDMAIAIIAKPMIARNGVKYISAPTSSGKTASVLPAFLTSMTMNNGGTHYLYLAFTNNNKRSFTSMPNTPNSDEVIAMKQGAAFIFECVKTLLERPDDINSYEITVEESPQLSPQQITEKMNEYLVSKLGNDCRIWFHVDEHGKMCNRSPNSIGDGAAFSRGAMETLARVKNAKVIATYIERPKSISPQGSSLVCRVPIALPPIDVDQVMMNVKELFIDSSEFGVNEMRMFSSLKVRLGFKLREINFVSVLHKRGSSPSTEEFLQDFQKAKNGVKPLEMCNDLCAFSFIIKGIGGVNEISDIIAKLLVGLSDTENEDRQFADVVSLPGGMISVSIEKLLKTFDPKVKVYNIGAELFRKTLVNDDLMSSTPLESAYYWTLSCRSALEGKIIFDNKIAFSIQCKDLQSASLFLNTSNSSMYDLNFLEKDIIYYANERDDGMPTHLLADLFFISNDDELVLVDITGGGEGTVSDKISKLNKWINSEQGKIKFKLRGIVLAPNVKNKSERGVVSVVRGDAAKELLGGLRSIAHWSEEPQHSLSD